MERDILILTKSWKPGGYCVVGVDINTYDVVRLVSSELPEKDALSDGYFILPDYTTVNVYDIVRVNIIKFTPYKHQQENLLIGLYAFTRKINTFSATETVNYIYNNLPLDTFRYIYNDTSYKLSPTAASRIAYSVVFATITNVRLFISQYHSKKVSFTYKGERYGFFAMTDPEYNIDATRTQDNPLCIDTAIAIISLPALPYEGNGDYYKIVAKIIPIASNTLQKKSTTVANLQQTGKNTQVVKSDISRNQPSAKQNEQTIKEIDDSIQYWNKQYDECKAQLDSAILMLGIGDYDDVDTHIHDRDRFSEECHNIQSTLDRLKKQRLFLTQKLVSNATRPKENSLNSTNQNKTYSSLHTQIYTDDRQKIDANIPPCNTCPLSEAQEHAQKIDAKSPPCNTSKNISEHYNKSIKTHANQVFSNIIDYLKFGFAFIIIIAIIEVIWLLFGFLFLF